MIRIEYEGYSKTDAASIETILDPAALRKAMREAGRSVSRRITPYAVKQVATTFTAARERVELKKYTTIELENNEDEFEFKATGKRLPLVYYKHNPTRITQRRDKLTSEVKRGSIVSKYPAFKQRMQGNLGIWQRTGAKTESGREKVRYLRGASVPEMLSSTRVTKSIRDKIFEIYERKIESMM